MFLKWALVIFLGYFIYKKYIALPPGQENGEHKNLKNDDDSGLKQEDDEYIDFEDVE